MPAERLEAAELAAARGLAPDLLSHADLGDDALVGAVRSARTASVLLRAGQAPLVERLLGLEEWEEGLLLIDGTGASEHRAALEGLDWGAWVRVREVDLEYVPPRVVEDGPGWQRLTGGLGVARISMQAAPAPAGRTPVPMARLLDELASAPLPPRVAAQELARAQQDRDRARQAVAELEASPSWRVTAPLRALKRTLRR